MPFREALRSGAKRVVAGRRPHPAIYGLGGGALATAVCAVVADKLRRHRGVDISIDNVYRQDPWGHGSGEFLLLDAGDTVIIEQFTYVSAPEGKVLDVETSAAPLDDGGIDTEACRTAERLKLAGKRAKYIYTIPTIRPTGSILSLSGGTG